MKSMTFTSTAKVAEALEEATASLQAKHPGQSISRSDTVRVAILALANTLQRVANPDVQAEG